MAIFKVIAKRWSGRDENRKSVVDTIRVFDEFEDALFKFQRIKQQHRINAADRIIVLASELMSWHIVSRRFGEIEYSIVSE